VSYKYLSRTIIICLLVLTGHYFLCAFGSITYYRDVLRGWGLDADVLNLEEINVSKISPKRKFLLLLSSQLSNAEKRLTLDKHTNTLVVVDKDLTLGNKVTCTAESCSIAANAGPGTSSIDLKYSFNSSTQVKLVETIIYGKHALMIPEQYFLIPDISRRIESYILSFSTNINDSGYVGNLLLRIREFCQSSIGELLLSFFAILTLFIVLYYARVLYKTISVTNFTANLNILFDSVTSKVQRSRKLLLKLLLGMSVLLTMCFLYIYNRNLCVAGSLYYLMLLIKGVSFQFPFTRATVISDIVFCSLLAYLVLFIATTVSYARPLFFGKTFDKYFKGNYLHRIKNNPAILLYSLLFLSFFMDFKNYILFYMLNFILVVVFFLNNPGNTANVLKESGGRSAKVLLYIAIISVMGFGSRIFIIKYLELNKIDLFTSEKDYVTLPYNLKADIEHPYKDYIMESSHPILINNLLVASPDYKKILNKPLSQFQEFENTLVLFSNRSNYFDALVKYSKFRKFLETKTSTPIFSISENSSQDLRLEMLFDCSSSSKKGTISLNSYSIASQYPFKNALSKRIFYFPGCSSNTASSHSYTVPLPSVFKSGINYIFELNGMEETKVINYKLMDGSEYLPITNYLFSSEPKVIRRKLTGNNSDPLVVYVPGNNIDYETNRKDSYVNLSAIINGLVERKVIIDQFTISSLEDMVPIRTGTVND